MGVIYRNGIMYGGGGNTLQPIQAEENQLIISDGDNWLKGGAFKELSINYRESSNYKNEYFISGIKEENDDQISSLFYFGGNGQINEGFSQSTPNQTAQNSFEADCYIKIGDLAKAAFVEETDLAIGEEQGNTYIFDSIKKSPFIRINDAAYIVLDSNGDKTESPVIIFHGGNYFDISNGYSEEQDYNTYSRLNNPSQIGDYSLVKSDFNYYPNCPWTEDGSWVNQKGTIFHLHDNSSFIMDGAPVFHMSEQSALVMDGNPRMILSSSDHRKTSFLMDDGTHFRMLSSESDDNSNLNKHTCTIIGPKQIYFGIQDKQSSNEREDFNTEDYDVRPFIPSDNPNQNRYLWTNNGDLHSFLVSGKFGDSHYPYDNFTATKPFLSYTKTSNDIFAEGALTRTIKRHGVQFLLESDYGTAYNGAENSGAMAQVHIAAQNNGQVYFDRSSGSNGLIIDDKYVEGNSVLDELYSLGNNSLYIKDVSPNEHSTTAIKIGPDEYAKFTVGITPSGTSSINFSPEGFYGYIQNSHNYYEYIAHPDTYFEYIDNNIFKQMSGSAHVEIKDGGAIILRKEQLVNRNETTSFMTTPVSFTTKNDYNGKTMENLTQNQIDFNAFQQVLSLYDLNTYELVKRDVFNTYVNGGEIISSELDDSFGGKKYETEFQASTIVIPEEGAKVWLRRSLTSDEKKELLRNEIKNALGSNIEIDSSPNEFSTGYYSNDERILDVEGERVKYRLYYNKYPLTIRNCHVQSSIYTIESYAASNNYNDLIDGDKTILNSSRGQVQYTNSVSDSPYSNQQNKPQGTPHLLKFIFINDPSLSVVSSSLRKDLFYLTSVHNFTYIKNNGHQRSSWNCPIQSDNRGDKGEETWDGPKFQLYDRSNFLMRGPEEVNTITINSIIQKSAYPDLFNKEAFHITNEDETNEIVEYLQNNNEDFVSSLNQMKTSYNLVKCISIENKDSVYEEVDEREITLTFQYKPWNTKAKLLRLEDSPTVEFNDNAYLFMTGASELRLEDGAIIRARENNGEIEYIFGDESNNNNQVIFTISELKALKALLTKFWTGSESDYNNIDNKDSDKFYYTWEDE